MRISKDIVTLSIVGLGGRANAYLNALEEYYSGKYRLVAVAEPDLEKQKMVKDKYNIPTENIFADDIEFMKKDRLSDVVMITTQDKLHFREFAGLLAKGYDIILEKPIATTIEEVIKMKELASKYPNQLIAVCHVLRHSPLFTKIKEIIDTNELGKIITIQHNENIGYYHYVHSYVRGPWRNSEESSPLILAKSCHDLDILLYLTNSHAKKIASFGTLTEFKKENFDEEKMADYCIDCKVEKECPFSALKIYSSQKIKSVVFDLSSVDKIRKYLGASQYGRCVYRCDNNVVDHQSTIIEFDGGITATFNISAFTSKINRTIKIMCQYGEIRACEKPYLIEVTNFKTEQTKQYEIETTATGHGGSDKKFIINFMEAYLNNGKFNSTLLSAVESHIMAFLAEKSRINGGKVEEIK